MNRGNIHVVAATVMLGAVSAVMVSSDSTQLQFAARQTINLPLWESFVTTDVPPLACLAAEPRLGVALARRATTGTSHGDDEG